MSTVIYGKPLANTLYHQLSKVIMKLKDKKITPALAIILVGTSPESVAYVNQKMKKARQLGIHTQLLKFNDNIPYKNLHQKISELNADRNVHGIIIQLPLPSHLNEENIPLLVDPQKDVDGFHPQSAFSSPISEAVFNLIKEASGLKIQADFIYWLKNKKIAVVGKGPTGGKPIINFLKNIEVNPYIIDTQTKDPQSILKYADIIVTAVGRPNLIQGKFIKQGSILVSIGITKNAGVLVGDYDEKDISQTAYAYTPTPGGVGPLLVAYLLRNVVTAAQKYSEKL